MKYFATIFSLISIIFLTGCEDAGRGSTSGNKKSKNKESSYDSLQTLRKKQIDDIKIRYNAELFSNSVIEDNYYSYQIKDYFTKNKEKNFIFKASIFDIESKNESYLITALLAENFKYTMNNIEDIDVIMKLEIKEGIDLLSKRKTFYSRFLEQQYGSHLIVSNISRASIQMGYQSTSSDDNDHVKQDLGKRIIYLYGVAELVQKIITQNNDILNPQLKPKPFVYPLKKSKYETDKPEPQEKKRKPIDRRQPIPIK